MAKIKAYELINRSNLASSDAFLVETDAGTRTINALNLLSGLTKCIEVLDDALDTATDTTTIYLHKVTSGSSTYVKGTVICTGSNGGYTQVRFRRSGSIEYRTGSSSSWGEWIKVCTLADVYTKQETDAAIAAVAGLRFAIVTELPPIAQASPNTIYLTPVSGQSNIYSQHICVNNAWHDLGTTNIDLSGKADVDSVYSKEDADDKFATKTELNNKADATNVYSKIDANARFALIRTSMGLAPVITTAFLPDTDVIPIGQLYIFQNRGYIRTSGNPLSTRHQRMMSIDDLNDVWDTTDALENDLSQKMSYAKHTDDKPLSDLVSGQGFYSDDTVGFKTTGSNSKKAYTTEYIDNALSGVENVSEVLDDALDTATDTTTIYLHKVTSGSSTYVKGTVICTGSNGGYTQFRFRRRGGIEYRTGTGSPISWGNYAATGDWIPISAGGSDDWRGSAYISHGDSITYQDGRVYDGTETVAKGYQTILKEQLGLVYTINPDNKGVNGSTMAAVSGRTAGVNTIKGVSSYSSYDICTIFFGTNDFKQGVSLGTLGRIGDSNFDLTTFYGAYRESIEYILTSNPSIQLVLFTPLQRNQHDYDVNTVNSAGLRLIDYVNAVKLVGQLYGIPVCDLYSTSGITQLTFSTYTLDGLHPNDAGYDRIGKLLARFFKSGFGTNDFEDLSGKEDVSNKSNNFSLDTTPTTAEQTLYPSVARLKEYVNTSYEKVVEVLDNALDTAVDTKTLYLHRVTSGSSTYIKGAVICAGSNNGFTQFRLKRSGGIEYRTGTGDPISWGNYTATGNWIKVANMSDIPTVDSALSSSSENPVQNKVVKAAIDGISQVPSGGTTGQVLTKTANGYAWQSLPLYNGGDTNAD